MGGYALQINQRRKCSQPCRNGKFSEVGDTESSFSAVTNCYRPTEVSFLDPRVFLAHL